ncbi:hypothetical protein A2U01_0098854, partial [Trifolium medium]|nr:hypothetical protein [Trifolium medium]
GIGALRRSVIKQYEWFLESARRAD